MKKTLFIVGNGSLSHDISEEIDHADFVMRFNEPRNSIGLSGTKTDILLLATSSKQMQKWLSDPDFLNSEIVRNTPEVLFAFHPSIIKQFHHRPNFLSHLKGRKADWTAKGIEVFGQAGKKIRIMPSQYYYDVCKELGITSSRMKEEFPSTGFFEIWLALRKCPPKDWDIKICGFSWEGWKRHNWDAEKQWLEDKAAEHRLEIIH